VEFVANQRIVEKEQNGVEAVFVWTFEPVNGGTRMTTKVEYTVPVPVLGRLAERFIIRANEREAQFVAENTKARIEGEC
jgi:hypothetical protein